jgi:hypothetical protein
MEILRKTKAYLWKILLAIWRSEEISHYL